MCAVDCCFHVLLLKFNPYSGTDGGACIEDAEAAVVDVAIVVNKGGAADIVATRTQPPPRKHRLRIYSCTSTLGIRRHFTFAVFMAVEVFHCFLNTQKENRIKCSYSGIVDIKLIPRGF